MRESGQKGVHIVSYPYTGLYTTESGPVRMYVRTYQLNSDHKNCLETELPVTSVKEIF